MDDDERRDILAGRTERWQDSDREPKKFFECGQCGHYHAIDLPGFVDCRDDSSRFTCDALDELYGPRGWIEVDAPEADNDE